MLLVSRAWFLEVWVDGMKKPNSRAGSRHHFYHRLPREHNPAEGESCCFRVALHKQPCPITDPSLGEERTKVC